MITVECKSLCVLQWWGRWCCYLGSILPHLFSLVGAVGGAEVEQARLFPAHLPSSRAHHRPLVCSNMKCVGSGPFRWIRIRNFPVQIWIRVQL